jgi:hypothetical protein
MADRAFPAAALVAALSTLLGRRGKLLSANWLSQRDCRAIYG